MSAMHASYYSVEAFHDLVKYFQEELTMDGRKDDDDKKDDDGKIEGCEK